MQGMGRDAPHRFRDRLLDSARVAVETAQARAADPGDIVRDIIEAWRMRLPEVTSARASARGASLSLEVASGFCLHQLTGIEGLAFSVTAPTGRSAGGIILRFPDEYPDSFERVELAPHAPIGTDAVWKEFFRA